MRLVSGREGAAGGSGASGSGRGDSADVDGADGGAEAVRVDDDRAGEAEQTDRSRIGARRTEQPAATHAAAQHRSNHHEGGRNRARVQFVTASGHFLSHHIHSLSTSCLVIRSASSAVLSLISSVTYDTYLCSYGLHALSRTHSMVDDVE